ncbi:DUF6443 domain-containing protein [uncultured Kordia sp.]|uniref:DUF6443 domain-containing protein n=1 Tax=uncultured Kordia sp. TaxID=507699 RepID=UPI002635FFFB|nr:DUF6443 domain-containing protein [uncultured Kordia sp.]
MKNYILLVLLALPIFLAGQTDSENYIKITTYKKKTQDGTITNSFDAVETITYYDGLGRPIQEVGKKAGGQGQDIIVPFTYDEFSRKTKQYLPYVDVNQTLNTSSLDYRENSDLLDNNLLSSYYYDKYSNDFSDLQNTNAYSEIGFEKSPLNRVLKQSFPGEDWKISNSGDDHTVKINYRTNTLDVNDPNKDNVKLFKVFHPSNNTEMTMITIAGYYAEGTLYKTITKDENWQSNQGAFLDKDNTTEEFKNKAGQVLLSRSYNQGGQHDTYYIYDDFANLTYIIPPLVNTSDGVSTDELNKLCYQYNYDYRNRIISKKLPAKGEELIVYDLLDRPVLTQDANLRLENKWIFTKYDVFGRIIYSGKITSSSNRETLQELFNANSLVYESRTTNPISIDGLNVYYSNNNFPNDNSVELLSVNYFDDYLWNPQNSLEANYSLTFEGIELEDNVISKTASNGWNNAGFVTDGKIEGDGYIQFTVSATNQRSMIGLSAIDSAEDNHYNTIDYAIYTGYGTDNRVYIYNEGVYVSSPAITFVSGDTFKVERSGNQILFKKNDEVFHAIEVSYQGVLIGDGSLFQEGMKISDVHIGYSSQGQAFGNPKGLLTGNILKILTTDKWTTSFLYYDNKGREIHSTSKNEYLDTQDAMSTLLDFTGKPINNKATHIKGKNIPIVTEDQFIYDNMSRLLYQTKQINGFNKELIAKNNYDELGQLIKKQVGGSLPSRNSYVNVSNISVNGNVLEKISENDWNGGLNTAETISGDGFFSFTPQQVNRTIIAGLSDVAGNNSYQSIKYAIYATPSGEIRLFDNGNYHSNITSYTVGDELKVERRGTQIHYIKNGETFFVSATIDNGQPLLGDVALYYLGTKIKNVVLIDLDNGLQEVDFTYNIRGWLKGINTNEQSDDLFSFNLTYNNITDPSKKLFNGNISGASWKTKGQDNSMKNYIYEYDALNRIKSAFDNTGNYNLDQLNYDKNGNIISLRRTGPLNEQETDFGIMDNLSYDYHGNQLLNVTDTNAIEFGFKDGNIHTSLDPENVNNDYMYDENGNIIKDKNKGINLITYNHLDLPEQITFDNNNTITYIYDATGVKLEKRINDYSLSSIQSTYYIGKYIYNKGSGLSSEKLTFFNTSEGYVEPIYELSGGEPLGNGVQGTTPIVETITGFDFTYQYKDHLENIRLSYQDMNGDGYIDPISEIKQENHYYPFGLKHKGYNGTIIGRNHNYAYNNKEVQSELELNLIDYGARNYDPSLARWVNIDPLAENYFNTSPYTYVANTPIVAYDPDGKRISIQGSEEYRNKVLFQLAKLAATSKTGNKLVMDAIKSDKLLVIVNTESFTEKQINQLDRTGGEGGLGGVAEGEYNVLAYDANGYKKGFDAKDGHYGKKLKRSSSTDLAHEIGHFLDPNPSGSVGKKSPSGKRFLSSINFGSSEFYAVEMENKVRLELGMKVRTHFDGTLVYGMELKKVDWGGRKVGGHYYNLVRKKNYAEYSKSIFPQHRIDDIFDDIYSDGVLIKATNGYYFRWKKLEHTTKKPLPQQQLILDGKRSN